MEIQKLVHVELESEGINVSFEDGISGVVPFDFVSSEAEIVEAKLESNYSVALRTENNRELHYPWDFFRREIDQTFQKKEKKEAFEARKKLGRRIRELRNINNLSQEDLAVRSGLNRTTISRAENGKHPARYDTLNSLATALNVSLPDLVTLDLPIEKVA